MFSPEVQSAAAKVVNFCCAAASGICTSVSNWCLYQVWYYPFHWSLQCFQLQSCLFSVTVSLFFLWQHVYKPSFIIFIIIWSLWRHHWLTRLSAIGTWSSCFSPNPFISWERFSLGGPCPGKVSCLWNDLERPFDRGQAIHAQSNSCGSWGLVCHDFFYGHDFSGPLIRKLQKGYVPLLIISY